MGFFYDITDAIVCIRIKELGGDSMMAEGLGVATNTVRSMWDMTGYDLTIIYTQPLATTGKTGTTT